MADAAILVPPVLIKEIKKETGDSTFEQAATWLDHLFNEEQILLSILTP